MGQTEENTAKHWPKGIKVWQAEPHTQTNWLKWVSFHSWHVPYWNMKSQWEISKKNCSFIPTAFHVYHSRTPLSPKWCTGKVQTESNKEPISWPLKQYVLSGCSMHTLQTYYICQICIVMFDHLRCTNNSESNLLNNSNLTTSSTFLGTFDTLTLEKSHLAQFIYKLSIQKYDILPYINRCVKYTSVCKKIVTEVSIWCILTNLCRSSRPSGYFTYCSLHTEFWTLGHFHILHSIDVVGQRAWFALLDELFE